MKRIPAYITINNRPFCDCGLAADRFMADHDVHCGYESTAKARSAAKVIRGRYRKVKILQGHCPHSPEATVKETKLNA